MADALRTEADAQPDTSLVAERDGVVVGHVPLSTALLDAPRALAVGLRDAAAETLDGSAGRLLG